MKSDLEFVRTIDPRLDINSNRNRQYTVLSSSPSQTWQKYPSTSFNNATINFTCNPPNAAIYVDRCPYIEIQFQLDFTGTSGGAGVRLLQAAGLPTSGGANAGTGYYDAPRCTPLANCITNAQTTLNNDSVSVNLNSYSRVYQRFWREYDEQNTDLSSTPSMPDQSQSYNDFVGFNRSPLNGLGDNVVQDPRGGFSQAVITANTALGGGDSARVLLTCIEPLDFSPYIFGRYQEPVGFIQLNSWTGLFVLGGRGSSGLGGALWSHASGSPSTISNISVTVLGASMYFHYLTPQLTQSIPPIVNYSYYEPSLFPTQNNVAVLSGASQQFTMNSIQLGSIPNRMYIWLEKRGQDLSPVGQDTDTYFRIENININWNNRDGILSNANPIDLYHMSLKAGLNYSYNSWRTLVGSVLCLQFGLDIPLGELEAPGKLGANTLTFTITATNISGATITPVLNCLIVQEGFMRIENQVVYRSVGVLDEKDIYSASQQSPMPYRPSKNIFGSGFWDDVGSFLKRLVRPAITAAEHFVPPQYQPVVKGISDVAKSYGYGGRGMVGGRMLTNDELKMITH